MPIYRLALPFQDLLSLYIYCQYCTKYRSLFRYHLQLRTAPFQNSCKKHRIVQLRNSKELSYSRLMQSHSQVRLVSDTILRIFNLGLCSNNMKLCWLQLQYYSFLTSKHFGIERKSPKISLNHHRFAQWQYTILAHLDAFQGPYSKCQSIFLHCLASGKFD